MPVRIRDDTSADRNRDVRAYGTNSSRLIATAASNAVVPATMPMRSSVFGSSGMRSDAGANARHGIDTFCHVDVTGSAAA